MTVATGVRIGVDIGGTFTDFALADGSGTGAVLHKQLTTPDDPSRAVLEGIDELLRRAGRTAADVTEIVHGTTLITNALIERRGAVTGMLVTEGFRDLMDIGREQRYDLFDLRIRFAEPIVPRHLRAEIPERIGAAGEIQKALCENAVVAAVQGLVEAEGIEALAICYLHSYANPAHEERTREIVARTFPGLSVSASADIFPYLRELERWTTTTVNAYAQPLLDRYLRRLEASLKDMGLRARLTLVGSSGGALTPETARRYPVRMLESGPAAGVLMSCRLGRDLAMPHVLSFDLGGTTAKGALVRNGRALKKYEFEAARVHEHKSGSGLALRIPAIDLTEIGAGGGSIAEVDLLGRLRVGPRSAGADPGPACYGRGGERPTLTDANLVLGYLDPEFFVGGRLALDARKAREAIEAEISSRLSIEHLAAASGIHDVTNETVARAFRMHATERGFDTRRSGMIAFGGGGPLHAARIARKMRIPRVVFPVGAGVMSALGMLSSQMSFEVARSAKRDLATLERGEFASLLAAVETEAAAFLLQAGVASPDIRLDRRVDMRYRGQGHELEVTLPEGLSADALFAQLPALFANRYREIFHLELGGAIEVVSWKVEAIGPEPAMPTVTRPTGEGPARGTSRAAALKGTRPAWFPLCGGLIDCPVYDRYALVPGDVLAGPALIEEHESTCLLDAGDRGAIDANCNLIADIAISAVDRSEARGESHGGVRAT